MNGPDVRMFFVFVFVFCTTTNIFQKTFQYGQDEAENKIKILIIIYIKHYCFIHKANYQCTLAILDIHLISWSKTGHTYRVINSVKWLHIAVVNFRKIRFVMILPLNLESR